MGRAASLGALSGFVAGIIIGGIGSRVAMRIVALTAGAADQGAVTEADAVVGRITADGTVGLIIFGAGVIGILGGLMYVAVRRWLADAGALKGLVYGLYLLAGFGWVIIEGDNPDFARFGYRALNVAMFALIFVLFGPVLATVFDRIDRVLKPPSLRVSNVVSIGVHGLGIVLTLGVIAAVANGFGESGTKHIFISVLSAYVSIGLPAARLLLARTSGRFERLSDLRGRRGTFLLAVTVLSLPVIAGLVLDARAIVEIINQARL